MDDDDRMTFRHTAGSLRAATVLFMLMGAVLMLAALYLPPDVKPGARPVLFVFGLMIALFGSIMTFGRMETAIDRRARTVTHRRWVLALETRRVYPLSQFTAVRVRPRRSFSRGLAGYPRFLVLLGGPDVEVYLTEYTAADQALGAAGEVGVFTGLPVEDLGAPGRA